MRRGTSVLLVRGSVLMGCALMGGTLFGCGDGDDVCQEPGTARCAEDGRRVQRCNPSGDGLRWAATPCPAATPTCVEHGVQDATCVAERIGECDFETFQDRCVDPQTLEDCARLREGAAAGIRHRMRCPDAQQCGEVPARALGEERPPRASHACYAPRVRTIPPALVVRVTGDVQLGDRAAPGVPFRVPPGTSLRLAEGAHVVVLVKERPSRLDGPSEVDVYTLQPEDALPTPEGAAIVSMLESAPPPAVSVDEPLLSPAPSEAGIVRVLIGEGVPGAAAALPRIEWRCETDCGRTVALRDGDRMLWRGQGDRAVTYAGPALEPDHTYQLAVGENHYRIETRTPTRMPELIERMAGWPIEDEMAVFAGLHRWSGSRAAAVEALRRARAGDRHRVPAIDALRRAYGDP